MNKISNKGQRNTVHIGKKLHKLYEITDAVYECETYVRRTIQYTERSREYAESYYHELYDCTEVVEVYTRQYEKMEW